MDHETALTAANQALSAGAPRGPNRIDSVDLWGVGEVTGTKARRPIAPVPTRLPGGTGELIAMLAVGACTLLFVLAVWFL